MELQQLRYVVALAQERNFRRAADKMHITQPTLSQQIQKLERELRVKLFERSPRQVRLTAAGESFLERTKDALETLERAVQEANTRSAEIAGTLRIGAIPTIAPYILPKVFHELGKTAPDLKLELHEVTTSQILVALRESRIDIGLVSLPINERDFVSRSIGKEAFYLAAGKHSALGGKKAVASRDVRKHPLIVLQEGHCFRNQSLDYCRLRPSDSRIIFQGSGLSSVLAMAEIGKGVTFIPEMAIPSHPSPGLRFLKLTDPKPERDIGFIWRVTMPLTRAHEYVMEKTEAVFKRL